MRARDHDSADRDAANHSADHAGGVGTGNAAAILHNASAGFESDWFGHAGQYTRIEHWIGTALDDITTVAVDLAGKPAWQHSRQQRRKRIPEPPDTECNRTRDARYVLAYQSGHELHTGRCFHTG